MSENADSNSGSESNLYFFNNDMKKQFSEIATELKTLEKISKDQLDAAKLAFEELPQDEQISNKEEMDAIEAKLQEDNSGGDAGNGEGGDESKDGQQDQNIQASETINAAIFAETGLNMDQIKDMQRKFSEMERAAKFAETEKKLEAYIFSDSNKDGVILPKSKEKFLAFASKLPDALQAEFFEILKSKSFKTIDTKEVGHSDGAQFSIPEIPAGYNRDSVILDHFAKEFQSKETGLKYEDAMKKAAKFINENGIK